jgi:hypothetical protein
MCRICIMVPLSWLAHTVMMMKPHQALEVPPLDRVMLFLMLSKSANLAPSIVMMLYWEIDCVYDFGPSHST